MKRLTLALFLGSVFSFGCGQRLIELPNTGNGQGSQVPTLTGILPQRGDVGGGTSVVLTGTHLNGAMDVSFGDAAATFNVDSDTQITAVSPPGTGSVNVTVLTGAGRSNGLPYAYGDAPIVTGITPAFGLVAGGQTVVITGSAFTDASSVTFGGSVASSFTVDSDSQISVVTPAHAAGTVQVVVTTAVAASNGFNFTYGELSTIAGIAPDKGPTTGGTVVTLTGAHFTGATQVAFDATPGTTITVVDDAHLTVTTPAHGEGDVQVTVTTPFGTSSAFTFTYGVAPALTSANPDRSPTAGGTSIILTGTHLLETSSVLFGTVAATSFTVDSDTQVTAVAPAGTDSVNITATTPFGTSNGLPFGYGDAAVETSIEPTFGLIAGGTSVTITGLRFTGATSVTFGGTNASFVVDSDTQITAVAPAHARGAVQVVTTGINGSSNGRTFTYGAVPALSPPAVPATGTTLGGTSVVLTGTDLTGATQVLFGLTPAASFIVNSDTQITAVAPAHAEGAVQIHAETIFGASNGVTFTYGVTPILTALNPASGDVGGTQNIVITGSRLDNATGVLFGSTPAASFHIDSPTQITAVSPAGTGSVNVTVTSLYGTSNGLAFAYGNMPKIDSLTPDHGLIAGGNSVVISGSGFTATSTVLFGSGNVTPTSVSSTQLTVSAPANTVGPVNVTVTNDFGTSNAATYTYGAAPTVTSLSPSAGPVAGGTSVTITGTGFNGTSSVTIDGANATFTVVSNTAISVTTPAHAAGAAPVVVTTRFGTANSTFTYVDLPTVTTVSPTAGSTSGGTTVTISGTNLSTASGVSFGGTAATIVSANTTSVTVTTPAHAAGNVDVVVVTSGGTATLTNGFSFVTPPVITSVAPASGASAGGTTVTITGTDFSTVSSVKFDGVDVTIVSSTNTSVVVTTSPHAAGQVDVDVVTAGGVAVAIDGYRFVDSPSIATLTPANGPAAGGTSVTISGTNLATTTAVLFDGVLAGPFTAINDTTVVVTAPPHVAGSVTVELTTTGGTAIVNNAYTYDP